MQSKSIFKANPELKSGISDSKLSRSQFTSSTGSSAHKFHNSSSSRTTTYSPAPVTEITPQLYMGSFENAQNECELLQLKITHIICLIGPMHSIKNIKYKHYPISDYGRNDLKMVIETLWEFFQESQLPGNKLFVHCHCGQNRAAIVVMAFLMKSQKISLKEAYKMVKKKRPIVQIHQNYAKMLSALEEELFGEMTMPSDWMEIYLYDSSLGKVVFTGEDISSSLKPGTGRQENMISQSLTFSKPALLKGVEADSVRERKFSVNDSDQVEG